jgi:vesicle-fusing ATPase
MEISLPDEKGRVQILNTHTKKMRDSGMMESDVDLAELAVETKNFSGAEIEGLVKSASSFALNRQVDATNGIKIKEGKITINRADFLMALKEIKPAFGKDTNEFQNCMRNGIIKYGPKVDKLLQNGGLFVQQVRNSTRTPLVSVLLEGPPGSGKTALASKLAAESDYPYVKLISAENLVGYSETAKCTRITKIFEDAYKSPVSCIVVDDIERILDYVRIGPRFSNAILQTLLVFLKKEPEKGRKLLILVTTSNRRILEDLEILECFNSNTILTIPQISNKEEFIYVLRELKTFEDDLDLQKAATSFSRPISVKKLIMIAEMAKQAPASMVCERFCQIMIDSEQ